MKLEYKPIETEWATTARWKVLVCPNIILVQIASLVLNFVHTATFLFLPRNLSQLIEFYFIVWYGNLISSQCSAALLRVLSWYMGLCSSQTSYAQPDPTLHLFCTLKQTVFRLYKNTKYIILPSMVKKINKKKFSFEVYTGIISFLIKYTTM